MCGICGVWNRDGQPVNPVLLAAMRDSMAHRGPDGLGALIWNTRAASPLALLQRPDRSATAADLANAVGEVGLGHRRLSIIDLNTGDQPMCNEDGSIWVVYNGEIYNYRELRRELQARGHTFKTDSDTEVVIHAYEEYGKLCPSHFNGIFGFAIWDGRLRRLFLARDHFGVKPIYYAEHERRFSFASELKAILRDPSMPRELDLDALGLCLTFRHTPSPWTLFKGIYKLRPGCSITVSDQGSADCGVRQEPYWDGPPGVDPTVDEDEWVQRLQERLQDAVSRQMVSDVPIGISLSSGVDSTTVLALMSRFSRGPVRAFTVGFANREAASEVEPARERAKELGAEFYEQIVTASDYAGFMTRYMWHLEEPIGNESAAAYYFVAKMAREHGVKVLLNGQGADEAFAGYRRYLGVAYRSWLRLGTIFPLPALIPRIAAGTELGERYQRFLYTLASLGDHDLILRVHSIMTDGMKQQLVRPEILAEMDPDLPREYVWQQLLAVPEGSPLERLTHFDARTSLPDNLLLCEDKMAMATGVEARVPFLDRELMDVAERIPGRFKLRGLSNKVIHRRACARWVGPKVSARPQIGFDNAVETWLRAQLGERMRDLIASPSSFSATYLNPDLVSHWMDEHHARLRDRQRILFLLLSLESWHEAFSESAKRPALVG